MRLLAVRLRRWYLFLNLIKGACRRISSLIIDPRVFVAQKSKRFILFNTGETDFFSFNDLRLHNLFRHLTVHQNFNFYCFGFLIESIQAQVKTRWTMAVKYTYFMNFKQMARAQQALHRRAFRSNCGFGFDKYHSKLT